MIRVHRPDEPPSVLKGKGKAETERLCRAFDEGHHEELRGEKAFDKKLYGHKSVKDALILAQHGKCAFCESRVTHIAYGDVEHFRPKAGYQQHGGDPLESPGYYWLAYEWSNLFFACPKCNQAHKKNLFPLRRSGRRAESHHHRLDEEEPLLIDCGAEAPETFLDFRDEDIFAIRGNARGKATIAVLGLDRELIVEARREHLHAVRRLIASIKILERRARQPRHRKDTQLLRLVADCRNTLRDMAKREAVYSSMVRAALKPIGLGADLM